jgi:hypothetical protein
LKLPAPDLLANAFGGIVAHCRAEVDKDPVMLLAPRQARAKSVAKELKPFVFCRTTPISILAIHNPRFGWVDRQPAGCQSRRY